MAEFLGIDPGVSGALAKIDGSIVMELEDMPVLKTAKRRVVDLDVLSERLCHLIPTCSLVAVEGISGIPRRWAASSACKYGVNWGVVAGMVTVICKFHEVPRLEVPPKVWKNKILLGTDKSKATAIRVARGLFPHENIKSSQDGRAEALLIAEYARRITA